MKNNNQKKMKIAVIGAGAAGLMAAYSASSKHTEITIFERNGIPGKKLLITGKGRCNITNSAEIPDIINNIPGNGTFMYSSIYQFSNDDIISFFENNGLKVKEERGGRIFPASDKSKDVVNTLVNTCKKKNIKILYNKRIKKINKKDNIFTIIDYNSNSYTFHKVIIATGGTSYKGTGSTGDGYIFAKYFGHEIVEIKPALIPLNIKEPWVKDLMGLSLRNVNVKINNEKGHTIYDEFGEMLFTHFGVSGPLIITAGGLISSKIKSEEYKLIIDLKPALDEKKLDARILRDFSKYSNKQFKNALNHLLPQKMIEIFVEQTAISAEKHINQISRNERLRIVELFKHFELTIVGTRNINEAIVTAGGVSVKEIDPGTMESKLVSGLYFAGELMDVDAYTGGYNLTVAFSTGYVAGKSASTKFFKSV